MSSETSICIPPVLVKDFQEFKKFARDAVLITYNPEFFRGPFIDDRKRLRRITLCALGVPIRGTLLTFKFVLNHTELLGSTHELEDPVEVIEQIISQLIESLEAEVPVVEGNLEMQPALGEILSVRP